MTERDDDSVLGDLIGPVTWPKVALAVIVLAFVLGVCAICGWAPGWVET